MKGDNLFLVDVEADGPCPMHGSMIELGIVKFGIGKTPEFYANMRPLVEKYNPEALKAIGRTREETLDWPEPVIAMRDMDKWLAANCTGRPVFVSDNPAFDWQWVNFYCWEYLNKNPFGFSARRIGDFAAGLERHFWARQDWKKLRVTKHTHNPVDDARGNCEALYTLINGRREYE